MADLRGYIEMGKELGLTGQDLRSFAESHLESDRKQIEVDRNRIDVEERERRAHERELKKMELEALEKSKPVVPAPGNASSKVKGLKLPPFDESKDKLDSFIERFERYATIQSWNNDDKAIFLSTLLRGKALDVYSRLPIEDAVNYEKLKQALLRAYQLTEEGFRKKFFAAKPEVNESPTQFIFRLEMYFDRWIELSEIAKDFYQLRKLILEEQFLSEVPRELALFVKERKPSTMAKIGQLSETYMETRGWTRLERKSNPDKRHDKKMAPNQNPNRTNDSKPNPTNQTDRRVCFRCQKPGHISRFCTAKVASACVNEPVNNTAAACINDNDTMSHKCFIADGAAHLKCGCTVPMLGSFCCKPHLNASSLPITDGLVENTPVRVMRDTGCNGVVIKRSLVPENCMTGKGQRYIMIDRTIRVAPLAMISVCTPFYTGVVEALCLSDPICELIIGNIANATMAPNANYVPSANDETTDAENITMKPKALSSNNAEGEIETFDYNNSCTNNDVKLPGKLGQLPELPNETCTTAAVTTRSQSVAKDSRLQPLLVPESVKSNVNAHRLKDLQLEDKTLTKTRMKCIKNVIYVTATGKVRFVMHKGLMYRYFTRKNDPEREVKQLILPTKLRPDVMKFGHETLMAGHLGIAKTCNRILSQFYWPGFGGDVTRYCQSCDHCQKTIQRGRIAKVPVQNMPLIDTAFSRVAIDLIGPIEPRSNRGNKYILTLIDFATRYPEAIALPSIDTQTVAEALINIYSRIGIPNEVLSDNGSQLTSAMMSEVCRLLSINQLTTTPYHAMCNGLCEKMNGTLKQMLRKMCMENPKDWDRYIEPLLFAYREVPQDSTGFSPFELVYGRTVRGPMAVLRKIRTKEDLHEDIKTTYEYVIVLRDRLETVCSIARDNLAKSQVRQKHYFDRHAKQRKLDVNSNVLVLLPSKANKLLMRWRGPYRVIEKVALNDYRIQMGQKAKVFHINMLKQYHERETPVEMNVIAAIDSEIEPRDFDNDELLVDFPPKIVEHFQDVNINPELPVDQQASLLELIFEFKSIFSSIPGLTNLVEHDIKLTDQKPLHLKPYPIPHSMVETVKSEVQDMLKNEIIEPAISPYRFPLIMVKKKDGTARPVIDFRKLNRLTVFDAEPMSSSEQIFVKSSPSKFLSKLDFCKGFWQIKLCDSVKDYTAFYTPHGSFRFVRLPFGLVNSGSTYNRLMRILLDGLEHVDNFVDDLLCHTVDWDTHLQILRQVFSRIQEANLTVKPSKCYFGYSRLEYLGHQIGSGSMSTLSDKVDSVRNAKVPTTKTELRSFLGLSGFYHNYVPNYATIAASLTDLIKKGASNKLDWTDRHDRAFNTLKDRLCNAPILALADVNKEFVVRVDASNVGIGAVLLQNQNSVLCPVSYASRKLRGGEISYSAIEKECLAVIWSVNKFMVFLYGKPFTLQTDHQPLAFLNQAKIENPRIMRWALFLQSLNFKIDVIKGKDNVGADFLSRSEFNVEPACVE